MGWNYLSIPKLQRFHRWSLGMDKEFWLGMDKGFYINENRVFDKFQMYLFGKLIKIYSWRFPIRQSNINLLGNKAIILTIHYNANIQCLWDNRPQGMDKESYINENGCYLIWNWRFALWPWNAWRKIFIQEFQSMYCYTCTCILTVINFTPINKCVSVTRSINGFQIDNLLQKFNAILMTDDTLSTLAKFISV